MVDRLKKNTVVGLKQTTKLIKNSSCEVVYIAKDAAEDIIRNVEQIAKDYSIEVKYVDTMKELGRLCGIQVGAATAAQLKDQ